jgi:hypothetical protein
LFRHARGPSDPPLAHARFNHRGQSRSSQIHAATVPQSRGLVNALLTIDMGGQLIVDSAI